MHDTKINAVADFDCRPTEAEIASLLEESMKYDDPTMTDEAIRRSITKAENWLNHITRVINNTFSFHREAEDTVTVRYVKGEDLGWGCDHSGTSPFNTVHPEGPTVYAFIKGHVQIWPVKEDYRIGLNFCTPAVGDKGQVEGLKIMLRVPEHRFFIAFQFANS